MWHWCTLVLHISEIPHVIWFSSNKKVLSDSKLIILTPINGTRHYPFQLPLEVKEMLFDLCYIMAYFFIKLNQIVTFIFLCKIFFLIIIPPHKKRGVYSNQRVVGIAVQSGRAVGRSVAICVVKLPQFIWLILMK